jgi:signal transduction histidine kinase
MKLINKLTIWYLTITTLVLVAGAAFVFKSVQHEVDGEEIRRLRSLMADVIVNLEKDFPVDSLYNRGVEIKEIDTALAVTPFHVVDTMAWHSQGQEMERQQQATASYKIHGKHFLIYVRDYAVEREEIIEGVIDSVKWMFMLLLIFVTIAAGLISKRIFSPFRHALQAIQSFSLKQKKPIKLLPTRTKEFRELNAFLQQMTNKALDDYNSLKEFTENASHELQTPLAVMRGKLELLMESNIRDEQADLIMAVHNSVEKLSKINQSLILLAKLENREYAALQPVNFSQLTHQAISSLSELIEMKSISLQKEIMENVQVRLNPVLADILLSNLLSNAIRHNYTSGSIHVMLNASKFVIRNTGNPPEVPIGQLFQRFKKNNQSTESVGLGLAIVKQICDINHFNIQYTYANNLHTIQINFHPGP